MYRCIGCRSEDDSRFWGGAMGGLCGYLPMWGAYSPSGKIMTGAEGGNQA